jgi:protein-tyrosine-phosphatase
MAAALLDHQAAGRVRVASAGSQPADQLNPAVVQAMAEIGLDISREFQKPLTTGKVEAANVVITMGCGDACPIYPANAMKTGTSPIPQASTSKPSAPSATTSNSESSTCLPS